jgi:hypothetical protein
LPISGTLLGVAGRSPVQNWAWLLSPAPGNSSSTRRDGLAAHPVQVAVVAVEFGRSRDAQAVAAGRGVAREHQLVFVIGEGDLVRLRGVLDRQRDRVALGRIDRQPDAQRRSIERAQRAHRRHEGVAADALETAFVVGRLHVVDAAAGFAQRGHGMAHREVPAGGGGQCDQLAREAVGIA